MTLKKLTAIVLTGALVLLTDCSDSDSGSGKKSKKKDNYTIGETWTVDGQWSLTIMEVTETTERNEYSEKKTCSGLYRGLRIYKHRLRGRGRHSKGHFLGHGGHHNRLKGIMG